MAIWRDRLTAFHLAGQHDQSSHGNWAEGQSDEPESDLDLGDYSKPVVVGQRLATAKPTGVKSGYVLGEGARMSSDLITEDQMKDKKTGPGLVTRITNIPGFEDLKDLKGEEFKEAVIERMSKNIEEVADVMMSRNPQEAAMTADWYPYINGYMRKVADDNGLDTTGMLAATAALSASAPWTSNVPWAQYLAENMATNKGPGEGINQLVKPEWAVAQFLADYAASQSPKSKLHGKVHPEDYAALIGRPLADLSDRQVAQMLRGKHDAGGELGKKGTLEKGLVRELGDEIREGFGTKGNGTIPQSIDNLEKAIRVLKNPTLENIDASIGSQNKVRSFYQNMRDPLNSEGFDDVTVDTHHFGIAFGMPMTVNTRFIESGTNNITSTPGNSQTGALGAYALVVEATRRAAQRINAKYDTDYHPNQIQSIVWESWKDYYPPRIRSNRAMNESIELARSAFARGEIDETAMKARIDAARTQAGGPTVAELDKLYRSRN